MFQLKFLALVFFFIRKDQKGLSIRNNFSFFWIGLMYFIKCRLDTLNWMHDCEKKNQTALYDLIM